MFFKFLLTELLGFFLKNFGWRYVAIFVIKPFIFVNICLKMVISPLLIYMRCLTSYKQLLREKRKKDVVTFWRLVFRNRLRLSVKLLVVINAKGTCCSATVLHSSDKHSWKSPHRLFLLSILSFYRVKISIEEIFSFYWDYKRSSHQAWLTITDVLLIKRSQNY